MGERDLMPRPFTLFTGQWADLPLEEVCALASSWGYDGLGCSPAAIAVSRSLAWWVNVCSQPSVCPGGHQPDR